MTAKTALVRLFVALVQFVTALVNLASAALRLLTVGAVWVTRRLSTRAPVSAVRAKLTLVPPVTSGAKERLATALTGMGFAAPDVRCYVASLGARAEREDIKALIVEGLRVLAQKAAS